MIGRDFRFHSITGRDLCNSWIMNCRDFMPCTATWGELATQQSALFYLEVLLYSRIFQTSQSLSQIRLNTISFVSPEIVSLKYHVWHIHKVAWVKRMIAQTREWMNGSSIYMRQKDSTKSEQLSMDGVQTKLLQIHAGSLNSSNFWKPPFAVVIYHHWYTCWKKNRSS